MKEILGKHVEYGENSEFKILNPVGFFGPI